MSALIGGMLLMYGFSDSEPTLRLYWDKPPQSFFCETEGTAEYDRRLAVSKHGLLTKDTANSDARHTSTTPYV